MNEEAFQRMIAVERKRTERSANPFCLCCSRLAMIRPQKRIGRRSAVL